MRSQLHDPNKQHVHSHGAGAAADHTVTSHHPHALD
jgi:hypothetical protein